MASGKRPERDRDALRDSQLRLKLALRAAQIGTWDWDLLTDEMTCSPRARTIFGFHADTPVTGDDIAAVTHPNDLPRIRALAEKAMDPALRNKEPYKYRVISPSGAVRWVLGHGEAIFAKVEGKARAVRYLGTIQDITEQKRNEDAICESQARLQLALDAARMAVWELIPATEEVRANPDLNRMFGFPEDATPTLADYRAAYGPGERERLQQAAQEAMAAGQRHFEREFLCRRPDGKLHWLLLSAEIILDEKGALDRVIGVLMDINERKRAEERQNLLARELNHRVRNTLSVVQSLASQTFRGDNAREGRLTSFRGQIRALAKANEVLLDSDWTAFSLRALIDEITAPYREPENDPFAIEGEDFGLAPHLTVPLALAMHELCTNAAKYGALASPVGRVRIGWTRDAAGDIRLIWQESGGPPVVRPQSTGFGMRLLSQSLSPDLGQLTLDFDPAGLRCELILSNRARA